MDRFAEEAGQVEESSLQEAEGTAGSSAESPARTSDRVSAVPTGKWQVARDSPLTADQDKTPMVLDYRPARFAHVVESSLKVYVINVDIQSQV
jgi:hypothetical protein